MNILNKKSKLYILNPVTKGVICILFILIFSFLCKELYLSLLLNIILVLFVFILNRDILFLFQSLRKIIVLLIVVGLFQGFIGKTYDYISALNAILKIIGVYWSAIIYTSISTQNELLYFWELCFKPLKIFGLSSNDLALTMVIAIRFLPVFVNEIERIKIAQISRGAKLNRKSVFSTLNIMSLIIPILTQAIMRSEELADAMEVRGYVSNRSRGRYKIYCFNKYDFICIILSITIFIIFIYIRFH